MMHFPPFSDFPLLPKSFCDSVENFRNFTFSEKIKFHDFHPQNFFMTFLTFVISLYFPSFGPFPSISKIFSFPPYFCKFSSDFVKFACFFTYFLCFSFLPYFYRDAFMHHTMHVLVAGPDRIKRSRTVGPYKLI